MSNKTNFLNICASWYLHPSFILRGKYKKENGKNIAKGIQGKRRVNGSICELKVNPRQNQQWESRARPPAQIFTEGSTKFGSGYILHQGLFSSTFYGGKRNSHVENSVLVKKHTCLVVIGCKQNLIRKALKIFARSVGYLCSCYFLVV